MVTRSVRTLGVIAFFLSAALVCCSPAAGDEKEAVLVLNNSPLRSGKSLSIQLTQDAIIFTGEFDRLLPNGEHVIDFLLDIVLLDETGKALANYPGDVRSGPERQFTRILPLRGINPEAIRHVSLAVRDLNTVESLERERRRVEIAERAAALQREKEQRAAALQREREQRAEMLRAEKARRDTIAAKRWPAGIEAAVIERKVMIGMTAEQMTLAWGRPQRVNQTLRASSLSEQWVYSISTYVYFENGRVTAIQSSR